MKYRNPVIPGFYPDPSVCRANGKYYMVCSSFHYFPGVPLFESENLVNWNFIGNVLTRKSQLPLEKADSSGGIYAPTIRYCNGRFYMVTTNVSHGGNFYVYTDDIYSEWSDPIYVQQGGIDPSLFFEDGKAYFMSNGTDDNGINGITQCEIDIETGKKLTPSKCIWQGAGGRFLESPHLYKIGKYYYLLAAEGGTEYGHMEVYARGLSPYGEFENYAKNPVLTNRNLGGYKIQGCGHGDLVEDENGNFWLFHLAFRQINEWVMHHITGREVYMMPITFDNDGWFSAECNGTTREFVETNRIPDTVSQEKTVITTFENTSLFREWVFIRNPEEENYSFKDGLLTVKSSEYNLSDYNGSPSFTALRQTEMNINLSCEVENHGGESGITLYMTPQQHYEVAIRKINGSVEIFRRLTIGDISKEDNIINIGSYDGFIKLIVEGSDFSYIFKAACGEKEYELGFAQTKYLSSEIAGNFTGVMTGLYSQYGGYSVFKNFRCVSMWQ